MIRRGGSGARVQEVVERTGARSSRSSAAPVNTIQALAQELVGLQPDIILASSVPATAALQRETRTIPIVFASVADPVGLVPRLNRPGGNVTGFATLEASWGASGLSCSRRSRPA